MRGTFDAGGIEAEDAMKVRSGFLVSLLFAMVAAASGSVSAGATPQMSGAARPAAGGVLIATAETPNGVALQFTTTGDVAGLRARVHRMAEMRNRMMGSGPGMQGSGMMCGGGMHGGMMGGGMTMRMVPSHASVEDIPGGARLVLTPVDPSQLGALRAHANQMAAMMRQGRCPMFQAPAPRGPGQPASPQGPAGV